MFTYCDSEYSSNLSAKPTQVLDGVYVTCFRFVYGVGRYHTIAAYIDRLICWSVVEYLIISFFPATLPRDYQKRSKEPNELHSDFYDIWSANYSRAFHEPD